MQICVKKKGFNYLQRGKEKFTSTVKNDSHKNESCLYYYTMIFF